MVRPETRRVPIRPPPVPSHDRSATAARAQTGIAARHRPGNACPSPRAACASPAAQPTMLKSPAITTGPSSRSAPATGRPDAPTAVGPGPVQMDRDQPDAAPSALHLSARPCRAADLDAPAPAAAGVATATPPTAAKGQTADAAAHRPARQQRLVRHRHLLQGHHIGRRRADVGLQPSQIIVPEQHVLLVQPQIPPGRRRPQIAQDQRPPRQRLPPAGPATPSGRAPASEPTPTAAPAPSRPARGTPPANRPSDAARPDSRPAAAAAQVRSAWPATLLTRRPADSLGHRAQRHLHGNAAGHPQAFQPDHGGIKPHRPFGRR